MATTKDRALLRQLDTLFNIGAIRELTDGQLLERFARSDGEAAELAFVALVERHGAMVLRVCRAQSADPHETQDAFQATFLVLVEKARGLWVRDSLGPWLHQVALRTASCARSAEIRRRRLERRAAEIATSRDPHEDPDRSDLERALHEEINRLPERYRVPIVLCDLEGRTCEEAARVMGRPVGTVKCWRSRGRERLRRRLIRAGLAPAVALASGVARAAVPKAMAEPTVAAAVRVLSDSMTAGVVPASVSALVKGVLQSMFLSKLRTTAAVICAMTFLGAGLVVVAHVAAGDERPATEDTPTEGRHRSAVPQPPTIPAKQKEMRGDSWPLSLPEAMDIGLEHSPLLRIVRREATGGPGRSYVIVPASPDIDPHRFRSEAMAEVRSIEQQYWNLGVAHVQLWAAQEVVDTAEEVVKRLQERSNAGRRGKDELDEAQQRLEQFRLDLVTRTSDVITTERGLRNLLGLPPADNRRILPVTPPTEARLEPDWKKSLAIMLEKQPDIAQARTQVKEAEKQSNAADLDRVAGAFLPDLADDGERASSADGVRVRTSRLERRKAYLQQVVHQTTYSLARFFLEIDANYKQFQTASRLRTAAAQRLDAQRAYYEKGRTTIDRFLDAVSQYATAVATEAQYKATYNIDIVALEEAKGTLLEYDKITVADSPKGATPPPGRTDGGVRPASHHPTTPDPIPSPTAPTADAPIPPPAAGPPGPRPAGGGSPAKDDGDKSRDAGKTYSFHLTIGAGDRPIEIRGSFTVAPARAFDATQARTR